VWVGVGACVGVCVRVLVWVCASLGVCVVCVGVCRAFGVGECVCGCG
jgi:hypothetical protein